VAKSGGPIWAHQPKSCVINLDTITIIAQSSLIERLSTLSAAKQKAVESALHFALGLAD
jgi:hypothetical protein